MKPIKALGQHFLNSPEFAAKIVESLSMGDNYSIVLEVGPGTGVLTGILEKKVGSKKLYLVEIDARAIQPLQERFPELKNRIIHGDFLHMDWPFPDKEKFAVIGNFPYNISSQILFKILESYERVPELVGMFQKEVAERIASGPGKKSYGILSVFLQAHYNIEYLFTVPENVFIPPPKVQSGVIRMILKKDHILKCDPVLFRKVVKTAFNQRRKTLRNSLKSLLSPAMRELPWTALRPEQLHYSQFVEITNLLDSDASH
jgi:16S rRNA (adenine1518-N6/adenine1519-N6)-dimethyltransferase